LGEGDISRELSICFARQVSGLPDAARVSQVPTVWILLQDNIERHQRFVKEIESPIACPLAMFAVSPQHPINFNNLTS
jgi:hypothetical protein